MNRSSIPQGKSEGMFRRTAAAHPRNYAPTSNMPYRGGIRL